MIGERLDYIREKFDIRIKDIQAECGIARNAINKWRSGIGGIREENLNKLLEFFFKRNIFVDRQWLLGGNGEEPKKILDEESDERQKIIKMFNNIIFNNKEKNMFYQIVSSESFKPIYEIGDVILYKEIKKEFYKNISYQSCYSVPEGEKNINNGSLKILTYIKNNEFYSHVGDETEIEKYTDVFEIFMVVRSNGEKL